MVITLSLPVRAWAALDAALAFFRAVPVEVTSAQRLAHHCRRVHQRLLRAGLRCHYRTVALTATGKSLNRLCVKWPHGEPGELSVDLSHMLARSIAGLCVTILNTQAELNHEALLEHEADELNAARSFLAEVRRQAPNVPALYAACRRSPSVRWDGDRQEYRFHDRLARRVEAMYRRIGASLN